MSFRVGIEGKMCVINYICKMSYITKTTKLSLGFMLFASSLRSTTVNNKEVDETQTESNTDIDPNSQEAQDKKKNLHYIIVIFLYFSIKALFYPVTIACGLLPIAWQLGLLPGTGKLISSWPIAALIGGAFPFIKSLITYCFHEYEIEERLSKWWIPAPLTYIFLTATTSFFIHKTKLLNAPTNKSLLYIAVLELINFAIYILYSTFFQVNLVAKINKTRKVNHLSS